MTSWAAEEVWGQDWAEKKKVFFPFSKHLKTVTLTYLTKAAEKTMKNP
jgi:hypothetical protein